MGSWAAEQDRCPRGHPCRWPDGKATSYEMCPDCPANVDDRGHFSLWCNACAKFCYPPNCLRHEVQR